MLIKCLNTVLYRVFQGWLINDAKIITRENIALCCCSCNASKGQKKLSVWLESKYCKEKNINFETVTQIIKNAIKNGE